ncbi:MAG: efflux RND transporter permease subunit [Verrucomicrobia bacterium]|nr:efflux RND transporter permease subunit [Verrucomicrobiota bacterium]
MLNRLLEFSLRQRALVLLATLVLIAAGAWSALRLPIDAVPDITNPQVLVNTAVPALAPEEIEKLVTLPLESQMAGLPGMIELRSLSKFGLSQIRMTFEDGVDLYRTRQLVSERLLGAAEKLPDGLQLRLAPISTALGEIFYYAVEFANESARRGPENSNEPLTPSLSPSDGERVAGRPGEGKSSDTNAESQSLVTSAATTTRTQQLMALKQIQEYVISPLLRATPGVAEVNTSGGYERQIVIMPDPARLASAGLSLDELAHAIGENTENVGGGLVEIGGEQIVIRANSRVTTTDEIAGIPLKFAGSAKALLVQDVAQVGIGSSFRTGAATVNGEEGVVGGALMLAGGNSRIVARDVAAKLAKIQEKLPPGVVVRPLYNRSDLVNRTLHTVETNLFEGALLVVVVLFALLGNLRAAFIVALAIPLSMLVALTGMVESRVSGNLMSLGAIDFGLIIDGAVVMVENIVRHLARKQKELGRELTAVERFQEVRYSAKEVAHPMFFGVLIITVVYIPILALTGIEGKMFRPMALTVIFALAGSLVLALTLMPLLCYHFVRIRVPQPSLAGVPPHPAPLSLQGGEGEATAASRQTDSATTPSASGDDSPSALTEQRGVRREESTISRLSVVEEGNWVVRFFKAVYTPLLAWALRFKLVVVAAAVVLFGSSLLVFTRLGAEFIPQLDEGTLLLQFIRSSSAGLSASTDLQRKSEKLLLEKFPEIERLFGLIGTAEIAVDPMGPNLCDTYVELKPRGEWRRIDGRPATKEQLIDLMRRELAVHAPGQTYLFMQPIQMRFNEMMAGVRADIAVKIFGDDFQELERLATEVRDLLRKIPGGGDVEFDAFGRSPLLEIKPDRDALRRYNLQAANVNHTIATALAGEEVGTVIEGNRRFPIVVRLTEDARRNVEIMKRLPVRTEAGSLLTLGQVARFEMVEAVGAVTRESGQRRAAILVNLRGRDTEGFVKEALARIKADVKFPPGYYFEFGGQFENLQAARIRLAIVVPMALALIFALIYISFGSVRQAALIFICVPLAVTGGVFALWWRALPFTISAGVGFIALSGIAVLNGIMLISFINQLRREGRDLRNAVVEGTLTRLRPKLMTALVASLGFVPMALSTGAGAEVQRPLATVVIGGIVSSTFLTLLVLPVLYEWLERKSASLKPKAE